MIIEPEASCGTCKHWQGNAMVEEAECRRQPPQVVLMPIQTLAGPQLAAVGFFPSTRRDVFCGEYTLKH